MRAWMLLLDMDHCLFHKKEALRDTNFMPEIFLNSNAALFESFVAEAKAKKINRIILQSGSNRQSFTTELANIKGQDSSVLALLHLQQFLSERLKGQCEVIVESMMMADIYSGEKLTPGNTFNHLVDFLKNRSVGSANVSHSFFDRSKFSVIYAQVQRVSKMMNLLSDQANRLLVTFVDDSVLYSHAVFNHVPKWLPRQCQLEYRQYPGKQKKEELDKTTVANSSHSCYDVIASIQGAGDIDNHYVWTARAMALCSAFGGGERWRYATSIPGGDKWRTIKKFASLDVMQEYVTPECDIALHHVYFIKDILQFLVNVSKNPGCLPHQHFDQESYISTDKGREILASIPLFQVKKVVSSVNLFPQAPTFDVSKQDSSEKNRSNDCVTSLK